jgi:hypothetical protein
MITKQKVIGVGVLGLLLLVLVSVGCLGQTSVSDYSPLIPVNVSMKYMAPGDGLFHAVRGWVCTDIGTFEVYGPLYATSSQDDQTAYALIPTNQTINVRIAGNKLWWDYTTEACHCPQTHCCTAG